MLLTDLEDFYSSPSSVLEVLKNTVPAIEHNVPFKALPGAHASVNSFCTLAWVRDAALASPAFSRDAHVYHLAKGYLSSP